MRTASTLGLTSLATILSLSISAQNVGIATATPGSRVEIRGIGTTSGTSSLNITNSAASSMMFVRNDGYVGLNTTTPDAHLVATGKVAPYLRVGWNTTIGNNHSFVIGFASDVDGLYAGGFGANIDVDGLANYAFGSNNTVSTGTHSMALGRNVEVTASNAITLGVGPSSVLSPLTNSNTYSIAMGANSNIPTLFLSNSGGIGNTGNVGIATTTPAQKLHVAGVGNTVRVMGIASAGTFADVGTRIIYADNDGDLTRIAPTAMPLNSVFWNILGNAGTSPTTNFIGTTDAQHFVTRTNNTERIRTTSAGLTGIWWATPAAVFDFRANATVTVAYGFNSSSSGDVARFFNTAASSTGAGGGLYADTDQRGGGAGEFYNGHIDGRGALGSGGATGVFVTPALGTSAGGAFSARDFGVFAAGDVSTLSHAIVALGENQGTYHLAGAGSAISATGFDQGIYARALSTNGGIAISGLSDGAATTWFTSGVGEGGNFNGYHGVYARGQNAVGWGIIAAGDNTTPVLLAAGGGGAFTGTATGVYADVAATNTTNNVQGIYTDRGGDVVRVNYRTAGTNYKIHGTGTMPVSCAVPDLQGNRRTMFAPEAPEFLFQDFGEGSLVNGFAHIDLDPIYSKNIAVNSNHPLRVFIQLEGDCNGVFVTNKTVNGFDVVELAGGTSNVSFQYLVSANAADEVDANGNVINNLENVRWQPVAPHDASAGVAVQMLDESHQKEYTPGNLDPNEVNVTSVIQP